MTNPTRRLGEESIGKLLFSFSLPAIAGMMVGSLYTIVDRAFLGNVVGPDALAGLSLTMPISFVIIAFGMLLGVGAGAQVSIRLGQQKRAEAEAILGNAFSLIVVVSLVLTVVLFLSLDTLLRAFGASEHTLPYAKQFMQVILFGSFFQYVGFGLNSVIRAEGNPRLAMFTMLINAVLNIVLDALFVLVFRWGVTGAAVATVISQAVAAVWTLAHFRSSRSVLKLRASDMRLRWSHVMAILAIGLSPFLMHMSASVINLLINRALSRHGGDTAISAFGIIAALAMLILMPIFGIIQGAQPIIGYNYGAKLLDRVKSALFLASVAATVISIFGFLVTQLFAPQLISGFGNSPSLVQVGSRGLRIYLLMLPVIGGQIVAANFFQSIGKAKISLVLSLLRQVIILIPLVLVLPRFWGLDGVWAVAPISDAIASIVTATVVLHYLKSFGQSSDVKSAEEESL